MYVHTIYSIALNEKRKEVGLNNWSLLVLRTQETETVSAMYAKVTFKNPLLVLYIGWYNAQRAFSLPTIHFRLVPYCFLPVPSYFLARGNHKNIRKYRSHNFEGGFLSELLSGYFSTQKWWGGLYEDLFYFYFTGVAVGKSPPLKLSFPSRELLGYVI